MGRKLGILILAKPESPDLETIQGFCQAAKDLGLEAEVAAMQSSEKDSWKIEDKPWNSILSHAVGDYPKEACGILLSPLERPHHITEAHPMRNATSEDRATRYLVDPEEFLEVLKWAEQRELDICGFYHSHPDHHAVPSEYDRQHAWESYLYLILSIEKGVFKESRAWGFDPEELHFREVIL